MAAAFAASDQLTLQTKERCLRQMGREHPCDELLRDTEGLAPRVRSHGQHIAVAVTLNSSPF